MALGTGATVAIVLGSVVVVGGGAYLVLRKKPLYRGAPKDAQAQMGSAAAMLGPKVMSQVNQAGRAGGGSSLQSQLVGVGVGALNKYIPGLGNTAQNVVGLAGKLPGASKAIGAAKSVASKALKKIKFW